ncbi:tyrosine-protein phosphatase non-receptor type 23 isoform 1 [Homo sapiens]|uniref:Tyrosine-protein phosphatase non-receptor type 23 n=3 Tax=Homo sapiens TaxID=9606 RepID=PTN23_HUMAN|nr:tyrosine-protein phosphatase non-receptor type 23 isoform 1 [Homo sapiens]Q9H3S7.1 RecName: Full=Tyrosine-protein phosphatase non-receptor type 23; AltName: Full=His domain-containing protein tyrosine phosphatase; Short=HD-PTP; AltName: Full=Protein tyrosine phosphatase TD14; Short=PTP-TD14 [Homo sapiens]AAH89042.1 Protein tyrosine phosphatase, non-receptor type 23 [Homo sapiens]AAK28025.1 protein tyrosine phosphatase TD14 [Homo sapiens]EAW64823.1 protein tyrosine phosphatase, non-receptor t|eukprot:NP_056281.1 tyrosine-protein phosphatase non-receptor type 23 isoform 1 [Homo sapiens]
MEAVPRMPMIWLDLKEAGDFHFQPAVKKFVLKNYGENPEAYNEELKKLELLRQNAVRVPRDFEGCSVLRKYLGQLHYLQSRVPMGSGQEAAVPVTWTEIFSGKSVAHEDIKYEQACILYNLGALHSMLGAMDKRVSEEGMKVSCTHFQCAAGAFAYLREHFPQAYSVDMSRQILTLNVNLMLGQAQECLLEKSMLDNRKSFLVARISAQVVDYYKEACRALENPDTASLLGRIQKDWKKLVQMKIYYFAAVAHLHMGKQAEEQQKFGERVAYFQSALDKLNEAIKLAKGQPDTVQDALRFTMDVIGGKYNSAKKDNDFIYHEAVPALDTLQPVKGAPLVKPLPVNPTDPAVTGPDIFAKLVPMAAHEASSLYSEEKAKLLREMMAKIEDKNEVLDQFMDSMQLDPETVDNLDAYSHIPPQLMEKCAALSVRPDTVRNLVQSMQVLSGVFTDVEASLKDIRDLLEEDELLEQKFQEAVGQAGAISITSKAELAEVRREWAKYMEVHEKASFTNSELHRAMNLHVGNLRLLSGPLDQVRAALPTPALSPEDKAVLQNLKRILAKVQEMRDQRVSLEQQLRELIQKDDITASLVTTDHSEMKKLFEEQLKKYDQLKVYLEQNLAAQDRVLCALTEANVQYAAVRRVLSDLDQKWNSTLQTLVASYEAYEDLMKKSQEGRDFYADLESKVAALLERTQSTCQAREAARQQLLDRELKKKPPPRPTAPKPLLPRREESEAVEAGDPPEELRSLPPDMVAGPRLPDTFLGSATPLHFPPSPFPSSTGPGPHYLSGPLPPGTYSGPTQLIQPRAPGPHAMPVAPGPALYPAPAYTPELGLVPRSSPQHGVVSSPYVGVGPAPPVAGLPSAPPPQFSGPELAMAVRPATTTVDSIQAPIPSHTAPRPNPTPAPPPPCFPVPPPQPLPTPYTYPAGAKQPIPAQHHFSSGIPAGFPAPRIGPQPQPHPQPHPSQAFGPQPPQQPLPLQHPHLFPPQAPGLLPPQSPYPYAPQPGVLGQPPPPLHTQLYPGPAQDPLPAHSGALPFPSPGPPQPPHPPLAYGPAPSTRPMGPQAAPLTIRGPSSAGQSTPSPHLVPSPAPSPGPGPVPPRPPAAEPPPCLRRGAAAADLLSSSPESQHGGTQSPGGGQPLLQPTKVDAAEGRRPQALRLIERDPYEHPERLRQLQQELEAFRGQLGDVGALDTVWRELQDAQEHDARGRSIAIARCYSLKNRHQDVMPYDSNRVVLRSGKDDYINASCVEGLSPYCPPLVATQAPLPGTAADFWLMVHEQKVSVIVMLVSEAEMEKQKVARYFPTERGQPMVHGALSLALSSVRSTETHVERVLSLQFRDQSLKRSLVHLHFPTWPELGLPDSPSNLLRFIQEVHAHYLHQRPLHTPIIVHCSSGVGRTGAFALLYAAVQEVEAGNGIPELPQLVRRMRQQRKHMLQEKLHLRFCYEAVVRHVEQVLQRHGVPPPCKPLASASISQKNHLPQDSQDLVLGGDVPISSIQATIAKLSIRPPGGLESPVASLPGPAEPPGLPPASLPESTPIPSSSPPPLSSPLPEAPQPKEEPPVPEAPSSGPPSSSLELLASLTPEAFSLDSSLRGKQRMSKHNFLQAHNGQGLRATRPSDDPLSLLDPLWTLNKT